MTDASIPGLSLAPFRALRPNVTPRRLADLLCPPYDIITDAERQRLLERDADNAVAVILPSADDGDVRYERAAERLTRQIQVGILAVDPTPALYVYEMQSADGSLTRGLLGAVELRDPADGVILPHENTMAGPVADRLALMIATQANLEPIYLVYDGGGPASEVVRTIDAAPPIIETTTGDGITHRLWLVTDLVSLERIRTDLATRRALIADGHHRYATYRELQRRYDSERGPGPWDRGLTLLVDSTSYGPQVHAIHRVLVGYRLDDAVESASSDPSLAVQSVASPEAGLQDVARSEDFAVVLTDGERTYVLSGPASALTSRAARADEPPAVGELDVTVVHRVLVEQVWSLFDNEEVVGYAHSVEDAVQQARLTKGTAVLLRPTPVAAVAAVAAAGGRMPRKSTLFTPKPASGLVMRRFLDG